MKRREGAALVRPAKRVVSALPVPHNPANNMGLFKAVGAAVLLVTLAILLPPVFRELEKTLIMSLQVAQSVLMTVQASIAHVSQLLPH